MCKAPAFPCVYTIILIMSFITLQRYQWRFSYWRKYVLYDIRILVVLIKTDTFKQNSTFLIDKVVVPLNEARIPFSSTQGVSKSL